MNRICAIALLLGSVAYAQTPSPFTLYLHDTTGVAPDTPLPTLYQLASTAVGGNTPTVLKMVNSSANNVYFIGAYLSSSATTVTSNTNFSVTGVFQDQVLVPGASELIVINLAPTATGVITGYLDLVYLVGTGGCVLTGPGTTCPVNTTNVSTFSGTATAAQLTLSYPSGGSAVTLTPASSSPLNFPNTSLSVTSPIVFTLNNASTATITVPAISLAVLNAYEPGAFSIDTSAIPVAIQAGQSANFTVTFAPSQIGLASGAIQIGSNTYPIQGYGIIVANIDSLQISYTNSAGVRTLPQAATAIAFGQVVPGSGASSVLTFNLLNPTTSANSVTIPAVTVSGAGFIAAGLPAANYSLSPGSSINFTITFAPTSVGSFSGSLSIGTRTFSLSGLAISSAVPGLSITTSGTVTSAQQLNLVIQSSAPATVATLGTVSMQFTPTISGVRDDAAVLFVATGGRQLNISFNTGAQTATYNNSSSIAFQTGTTAGTLTFTVAFPNTTTYTQSFTIPGTTPQVASIQATRESPNLVVNLTGYDNTYSAGQLSFTFYDTSGKVIGSPIAFNETSNFQQLFFVGNTYGGLFSLEGNFPVSGDITKVGSVTVGVTNSAGQSTSSATFQ
jgi:hypothetical protein